MSASAVLFAVAIFCSSLLAGAVVTVSLVMAPALRAFSARAESQRIERAFGPVPDSYVPPSLFISIVAAIALLADGLTPAARILVWAAIAQSIPVILISFARLRLDREFSHVLRTVLCVAIAACYIVAAGVVFG